MVVWLAGEEHRISTKAQAAIDGHRQTENGLAISDFTLYELSLSFRKKRIGLTISLETLLSEVEKRSVVLPITGRICASALSLPAGYSKDPGDRIIGATALVEGLTLVTADAQIRNSRALTTIW